MVSDDHAGRAGHDESFSNGARRDRVEGHLGAHGRPSVEPGALAASGRAAGA
jgi:hypothetical protein